MKDSTAHLINYETVSIDDIGEPIKEETLRLVFVNEKSIRQTEFYQASSSGLKPELMLEIRTIDYEKESMIIYENKKYSILRTFVSEKNSEFTELVLKGVINGQ